MEIQRPFAVITNSVDGDVLRVLAGARAEFTVPQLHRLIGNRSVAGIRETVRRLVSQGIVDEHGIGRDRAYALNDDHLAAGAIREIADLRAALIARLRDRLASWSHPPVFAALFGSAARGEMAPDSDLDLVLVRPDGAADDIWLTQLADLTRDATAWTGNDTRIIDLTADEVAAASFRPLLTAVAGEGVALTDDSGWLSRALGRAA